MTTYGDALIDLFLIDRYNNVAAMDHPHFLIGLDAPYYHRSRLIKRDLY